LGSLKVPDPSQEPLEITLKVFEKDLQTGEQVEVEPLSRSRLDLICKTQTWQSAFCKKR
jgi:hypothetical protein